MNNNKNILGVLAGMLVGGLAGALTMLLLAPQSGEKTRTQIQEKSIELRDLATEMVDDTLAQLSLDGKKFAKIGSQKAKELIQQGQELVVGQLENVSEAAKAGQKAIQSS
jgi:gas vesicle protein